MDRVDVDAVVIGGGIAGVSAAHFLAEEGSRVVLVEAEPHLAHHTTGRSAALYFENYGEPSTRPLSRWSRAFFEDPPSGLSDGPLLSARGAITLALTGQLAHLDAQQVESSESGTQLVRLDADDVCEMVPCIRRHRVEAGLWEPDAADMDVAGIHQAFVRGLRRAGGEIRLAAPVTSIRRDRSAWLIQAGDRHIGADVVVNAAGAWCDRVAEMAGVAPVGLVPMRRTAFMVPGDSAHSGWPLVVDADHSFYFKPDGEQLLCSLAEESPSEPCDARPEEHDIAQAIERINQATTLGISRVRSSWAGLRSFVGDRAMVIGFDPGAEGFFWLAGQGGTGIQSAPAAGRLTADLIHHGAPSLGLAACKVDVVALSPARLRQAREAGG